MTECPVVPEWSPSSTSAASSSSVPKVTIKGEQHPCAAASGEATSPVLEELVVLSLVCGRTGQYRVRSARKSSPVTSSTRSTVDLVGSSATNSANASLTAANRNHETDWMLDVRAPYIPPKRRRLHRSEVKRLNYQQLTRSVAPFQFWPKLSVR